MLTGADRIRQIYLVLGKMLAVTDHFTLAPVIPNLDVTSLNKGEQDEDGKYLNRLAQAHLVAKAGTGHAPERQLGEQPPDGMQLVAGEHYLKPDGFVVFDVLATLEHAAQAFPIPWGDAAVSKAPANILNLPPVRFFVGIVL